MKNMLRSVVCRNVPDNFEILFMQGGGTGQFAAIPLNLKVISASSRNPSEGRSRM